MGARFTGALGGLLVLVFGAGALVLVVWGDDPLESGAQRALRIPERLPREINLFNAVSGFGVAEGKDPVGEGYAAVSRVNKLLASPGFNSDQKLADQVHRAWVSSALTIEDEGRIICSPKAEGCLAQLWKERDKLRALARTHETLLHRYRTLAEFLSYQMELAAHIEMPLPKFRLLMKTHRLWLGLQATSYLQGDSAGLSAVLSDLRFLRRVLAQADDLLTKMVFTGMVVESLHVYAALMDKEGADPDTFPEIESLSAEEASLERALVSEFRFLTSAFRTSTRT